MSQEQLGLGISLVFKEFEKINNELQNLLKKLSKNAKIEILFDTKGLKEFEKSSKKSSIKTSNDYEKFWEKTLIKIENKRLKNITEIGKVEAKENNRIINENYKNREDVASAIAKTEYSRINENAKQEEQQAKATNKTLEENYKSRLDLQNKFAKSEFKRINENAKQEQQQAKATNKAIEESYKTRLDLQNKFAKSEFKRINENAKQEELQAKAINNTLEQRYKDEQKIEIFQKKQLENLKQFKIQFAGMYNVSDIKKYEKSLLSLNSNMLNSSQEMKKINLEFIRIKNNSKNTASQLNTFGNSLKNTFKKVTSYISLTTLAFKGLEFGRDTIQKITELDSQLTEISRVTNLTRDDFKNFSLASNELAKSLSKTTSEVLQSQIAFSKMGESLLDTERLSKISQLISSVGDISVETANKGIITLRRGFALSIDEVEQAMDGMNEVANRNAVTVGDLVDLYTRASSTLKQTGDSVAEATALFVAGQEVVQDSEKMGTALRTVALRLRSVKKESKNSDVLIAKLNESFGHLGISVTDSNGDLKSTFEIMGDLSKSLKGVNTNSLEVQKALQDAFGKRSSTGALAIIQNWDKVEKSLEEFQNSTGSAQQEFERYQDSVVAHQKQLQASIENLQINLLKSDTIKNFIDMTKSIVDNTSALGDFNGIILAGTIALAGFVLANKKALISMEQLQITSQIGGIKGLASSIKTATLGLLGFKTSADTATVSATGLNLALSGLLLGLPLIAQGIGAIINLSKKRKESIKTASENAEKTLTEVKITENLIKEKEKLEKIEDKTNNQKERLRDVNRDLINELPNLNKLQGNENKTVEEQTEAYRELNKEKARRAISNALKIISEEKKGVESARVTLENFQKQYNELVDASLKGSFKDFLKFEDASHVVAKVEVGLESTIEDSDITKDLEYFEKVIDKSREKVERYDKAQKQLADAQSYLDGEIIKTNSLVENSNDIFDSGEDSIDQYNYSIEDVSDSISSLDSILDDLNDNQKLTADTIDEIINRYPQLIPYLNDEKVLKEKLLGLMEREKQTQTELIATKLETSASFYNYINTQENSIMKTLANNYNIDLSNFANIQKAKIAMIDAVNKKYEEQFQSARLLQMNPDMSYDEMLNLRNERMQAIIDARLYETKSIRSQIDSIVSSFVPTMDYSELDDKVKSKDKTSDKDKTIETNIKNESILDSKISDTNNSLEKQRYIIEKISDDISVLGDGEENRKEKINKINEQIEEQIKLEDRLKEARDRLLTKELTGREVELADLLGVDISDIQSDEQINKALNEMFRGQRAFETEEDKTKFEETYNKAKLLFDEIRKIQSEISDKTKEIHDLEKSNLDLKSEIKNIDEKALETLTDMTEEKIKQIKLTADKTIKAIENENDAIQKQIDILNQINEQKKIEEDREKRLLAIEESRKKLQNIKEQKTVRLFTGEEFEFVADPVAVKEAQDELDKLNQDHVDKTEQEEQKALIDSLEKQKKYNQEKIKDIQNALTTIENKINLSLSTQGDLFTTSGETINNIVKETFGELEDTYGTGLDELITEITPKVNQLTSLLNQFKLASSQIQSIAPNIPSLPYDPINIAAANPSSVLNSINTNNTNSTTNYNLGGVNINGVNDVLGLFNKVNNEISKRITT